jgi:hypothetical protein
VRVDDSILSPLKTDPEVVASCENFSAWAGCERGVSQQGPGACVTRADPFQPIAMRIHGQNLARTYLSVYSECSGKKLVTNALALDRGY